MQDEIAFGKWLHKQRRAFDLSRKAFADQVGCAEITLRRIEAGTLKPSKELASILIEKLGIPEAERPQWISFARGLSGFPIKSTLSSSKPITNLPASLTTFIGREKEQEQVIQLIDKHRLVTLTGSGGIGKTRLSIKVAEQVLGNYPDGVWLVKLAPLSDPALLSQTVAILFGLTAQSEAPYIDLTINFLRSKSVLLILDNCEHLLDACAHFSDTLLKNCPELKILATSREPLDITGEAIYRVPSLTLPELSKLLDAFRDFESVTLFEERAQLVQFDFSLTLENAASVAQICHRLDGIPLAIELAAAKVGMLSTEQIAKQLEESFNVLTGRSRTVLPRHQTLRASMNWSWGLLTEVEQTWMSQLSVFAGGWTLEAAREICRGEVDELTDSLMKKSLIVMNRASGRETRYRFHETIRQYAGEKLLEAGGSEVLRDKHLAYFVKLVEQAEPELYRSNQVVWFNKLEAELDNLRMAMEWALATNVGSGLRIASCSYRFWDVHGYLRELGDWLRQLLEQHSIADGLHAQALAVYSFCYCRLGNFSEAIRFAERSLQLARTQTNKQTEAFSLQVLGVSTLLEGNLGEGTALLEQCLAIYCVLEDKIGQANTLERLSYRFSDPEREIAFTKESLSLYRELGNLPGIVVCLNNLSHQAIFSGDFSSPALWLEEALSICRQLGDQTNEAYTLSVFGNLAYWQGDYQRASSYYHEVILLTQRTGDHFLNHWAHVRMAYILLHQGEIQQAREMFEKSIRDTQKADSIIALVFAVEGLASLNVNLGQFARAAELFAWADAIREKNGDPRPSVEQNSVEKDLAVIHSKLDDIEFAKFSEEGRAMTVEQVIALASDTV